MKQQYYFFDKNTEKEYKNYFKKFPVSNIDLINKSKDGSVLLKITADNNPGEYYLYNLKERKFKKIADANANLNKEYLAKMIHIEYKTRDGITIKGYLTIPKNKELKIYLQLYLLMVDLGHEMNGDTIITFSF